MGFIHQPPADPPNKLIKPWALPSQKAYLFKNVNVVDTLQGTIFRDQRVKIAKGIISFVSKTSIIGPDEDVINVDCDGKYLCPGLIDCHVRLAAVAGGDKFASSILEPDPAVTHYRQPILCQQMLGRGFTTVRDMGGATLALKEATEDDVFPGPRLFIANKELSQTGGHGDFRSTHEAKHTAPPGVFSEIVDGVPDCTRAAREQLRQGADFIKISASGGVTSPSDHLEHVQFARQEIQAITTVAGSQGKLVTAHAYTSMAIHHAIDGGVRGIECGNFLDEDTAMLMAAKNIWLTPTLVACDAMSSNTYAGFLPPENQAKNHEVLSHGLESLRTAEKAGVLICHGSALSGPLHVEQNREFSLRALALDNKVVLQGATVNAAKMLGQQEFLGQVRDGFAADLVFLNRNPLQDVAILAKPEEHILAVVKNGRVYMSRWSRLPEDIRPLRTWLA